jgi:peroxiredoxin Q/BCP
MPAAKKNTSVLEVGAKAPAFSAKSDSGKKLSLKDFAGQNVVLYFYPKDDTPGCTTEACAFRDEAKAFAKYNAVVLGVSPDDEASHKKFKTKYKLNFPLLSDIDHKICEKYGVWTEKNMYGRKYMGVQRTTFVIDKAGKIAAIWPKVKVAGHSDAVIDSLKTL